MPRPGQVYVMDTGDGRVKVGFSRAPSLRSVALGGLRLVHTVDWHDQAETIERAAHKLLKLAGLHSENELFIATVEQAIDAIGLATEMVNAGQVKTRTVNRYGKMVSFALDPTLLARLDAWIGKQELSPTKTAVIELALREFLDRREKL